MGYSRKDYNATECGHGKHIRDDDRDIPSATLKHLEYLPPSTPTTPALSKSLSGIPRTSRARLSQPDVSPTPFPDGPIELGLPSTEGSDFPSSSTVLYLAYGSNMCAKTFLGMRKIRPISQVNVSAPSIRLTFDLPGIPYLEPCFANIALRKLPKKPPVVPIPPLDPPKLPPPGQPQPPSKNSGDSNSGSSGDWNMETGGLIGVVYEVTTEDYARILATEGGGASYHEILVPCIELPAPVRIPEHPRPDLPKPFLARTLYAPQLPDVPDDPKDPKHPVPKPGPKPPTGAEEPKDPHDPHDPQNPPNLPPKWRRTLTKLLLPIHRPSQPPTQPSLRYLTLLRSGALEHELPPAYQSYLDNLEPYTITSTRQKLGRIVFMIMWMPWFFFVLEATKWVADEKGKVPGWWAGMMAVMMHVVWGTYDWVFKPVFGEGERTVHDDDDDEGTKDGKGGKNNGGKEEEGDEKGCWVKGRKRSGSWLARRRSERAVDDEEKRCLLDCTWEEDE
ncbi:hypothetical protein B0T20DRAFT_34711 [Sordaria brevicollis]|uniref:gamma-glutamylcyclotransferase n=1 Tax=Sordaria brevicollis TaxID=83679 RepID=A0AAE0P8T1_SORBR|nr:hypothetical protein B0T20DRAFT_34711 [Sordaria brevicollis]